MHQKPLLTGPILKININTIKMHKNRYPRNATINSNNYTNEGHNHKID